MKHVSELLSLALEQGWKLGLLLILFCGAVLLTVRFELFAVPNVLAEWSGAGFLFGVAASIVSGVVNVVIVVRESLTKRGRNAENLREIEREHSDALKNLTALTREELQLLSNLLIGPPRFEVHQLSNGYPLLQKGVLRVVKIVSGISWICEVHPAFLAQRKRVLHAIERVLSR